MWTPARSHRLLASCTAAVAVVAVAGCGGSAVEGQNPDVSSVAQAENTAPSAEAGAATGAEAIATDAVPGVPAQADLNVAVGAPGGSETAKAPGAGKAAGTGKEPQSGAKGDSAAPSKPVAASRSAVEDLIDSAPIFGGRAACKPATLSEVNIGNVSTLSGVLGELFSPIRPALQTFVTSQNACGGLNGHKIKFFIDDDQGDPSTAVSKVQDMILSKKVLAFVGNIQVLTIDAVVPTIKRYGVPIIGGNLSSTTWFTNPLIFPQGSNQLTISYAYLHGATKYHGVKNVGDIWCIEVPRACEQINRGLYELAPALGATIKKDIQVSITAPSYVQQCLEFKNAGVQALALTIDAASMKRLARSCVQTGYHPKLMAPPLSLGNEQQFFGNEWLGNTFVPMNVFPWMGNSTAVERYFQAAVNKYNPGFVTGGAAALGWSSGALLVAAAAGLSEANPTTQQLLDTLWTFKGQKFTTLGGASPSPLTFQKDGPPRVPYCFYAAVSNDKDTGWKTVISKPICSDVLAPSDPQATK